MSTFEIIHDKKTYFLTLTGSAKVTENPSGLTISLSGQNPTRLNLETGDIVDCNGSKVGSYNLRKLNSYSRGSDETGEILIVRK